MWAAAATTSAARSLRRGCDSGCDAYITGNTLSTNFPATIGQTATGGWWDNFATALNASGGVVYSRYLGGAFYDAGAGIAVDQAGRAYITGTTHSVNFPTRHRIQAPGAPGGQLFAGSGSPPAFSQVAGWPGSIAGTVRSMVLG